MKLLPNEVLLVGRWVPAGDSMRGDLPGGGPPRIEAIPSDVARKKYRWGAT